MSTYIIIVLLALSMSLHTCRMIRSLLLILGLTGALGFTFAPPEELLNIDVNSEEVSIQS